MEITVALPQDIQRLVVSYLDTDSDLYYKKVIKFLLPDYSKEVFENLLQELPKILAIPRYLHTFKNVDENFAKIYAKSKTNNDKTFIRMNKGNSFITEWVLTVYH